MQTGHAVVLDTPDYQPFTNRLCAQWLDFSRAGNFCGPARGRGGSGGVSPVDKEAAAAADWYKKKPGASQAIVVPDTVEFSNLRTRNAYKLAKIWNSSTHRLSL